MKKDMTTMKKILAPSKGTPPKKGAMPKGMPMSKKDMPKGMPKKGCK